MPPRLTNAKFSIGQLVTHELFGYRGVIVDVDPQFQLTDEWYDTMARSRPPRDRPWYHVLVHQAAHQTYVAERNLRSDDSEDPIVNPLVEQYFTSFENGHYRADHGAN